MSTATPCQAILLAGGGGSRLYPLTANGLPKVLLPVANRPLLSFPLRMLEQCGICEVLVVCEGESAASAVRSWLAAHYVGLLRVEVARVAEGLPALAALRAVVDRVKTESFVLLSGDVVTEVPLRAQLLTHHMKGAVVTALFGRRRTSPAADTQPGRAPRNVDYVGLADEDRLVFFAHSPDALKELRLPQSLLRRHMRIRLTTLLTDMQVYVFNTATVKAVLEARPDLQKLEDDLLPYLVRKQATPPVELVAAAAAERTSSAASSMGSAMSLALSAAPGDAEANPPGAGAGGGSAGGGLLLRSRAPTSGWLCAAYIAPEGAYCQRANTLPRYANVNHDATTPEYALKLLNEAPAARFDNFVAAGVIMGARTTIGAGCMVGADTSLGDKCSVKRSVVGRGCHVGSGCKVINSVIMDGARVGDNCHVQNTILCGGCEVREGAQLKDCQVAAGFVVPAGADVKGEALCLTPQPGGWGAGGGL